MIIVADENIDYALIRELRQRNLQEFLSKKKIQVLMIIMYLIMLLKKTPY